jgi:hypothetical protein
VDEATQQRERNKTNDIIQIHSRIIILSTPLVELHGRIGDIGNRANYHPQK